MADPYLPPRVGQRYGLLAPLRNDLSLSPVAPPEPQNLYYDPSAPAAPTHPTGAKVQEGEHAQFQQPEAQQLDEHERLTPDVPSGAPAGGDGLEVAASLDSIHGVLMNVLDAVRDLAMRPPLYQPIELAQGKPAIIARRGRRNVLLWMPTATAFTLSGIFAPTTITPKIGWNVLFCPDQTEITLNSAGPIATVLCLCDEVPPGAINN